ncbi:hypothetical protein C0995_003371 [Termitomyces sp. Mi166|nr:hypothetical protein C0995_003371 [Termitomyces sp. Mi166\
MRVLKILEPVQLLVKDPPASQPIPEPGTFLMSMRHGQIRCMEFKHPFLRSLPSLATLPPPSSDIDLTTTTGKASTIQIPISIMSISTLDPSHLQPTDFIDLSNRTQPALRTSLNPPTVRTVLKYHKTIHSNLPFPPSTQGFLYMYTDPRLPILASQIRFRITPSNDPAQFASGTDLVDPHGEPWTLSALDLAYYARFEHLKQQLLHDGYTEYIDALSKLPKRGPHLRRSLYYLEQPFVIDMSDADCTLAFISSTQIVSGRMYNIFVDLGLNSCPYTGLYPSSTSHLTNTHYYYYTPPPIGRLILRFERSTLPEHTTTTGTFVVLRILKILSPIQPVDHRYNNRVPVPRPGELVVKPCFGRYRVRAYDLDGKKCVVSGLRGLPSLPCVDPDLSSFR